MNRTKKLRNLKVAALLLALSAALYATIVFDPDSQPALTTSPYALQDTNLAPDGTKAYRTWYENGAWTGDLIEYAISAGGARTTTATPVIGNYTESELLAHAADSTLNWTARSRFAYKEANVANYWQETSGGRQIFTYVDTNNDGVADAQADFLWDELGTAQQLALDPATVTAGLTSTYDSDILNFIRGNRSDEKSNTGGTLRIRYSLLGDIVDSWPVYVGPPTENYTFGGFVTFKNTHSGDPTADPVVPPRPGRIVVGANDGMLHAFDEVDGSEVWAYIPSMLLDKLDNLTVIPYTHTYYVDGKPTVRSAQIGDGTWKTVLTSGMGAGAKGLFVLDMTDASPDPSSDNIIMYEKTGNDFGYIYGQPSIFRLADDDWYIVTGNGFGSTSDTAKLLLISLSDGSVSTISTGASGAGLAAISLVDVNRDNRADFAYGGDTDGDMWKFDLTDLDNLTATKIFDGDPSQPITTRPEIGVHPEGGFMVLFGTGSALSLADAADDSYPTQAIYGIWDSATNSDITDSSTVEQTMVQVDDYEFTGTDSSGNPTSRTENVRYISTNNPVEYTCPVGDDTCDPTTDTDLGWKVALPANERVIGPPLLRAGRITVMTTNPTGTTTETDGTLTTDLEGDSWLTSLYYLTGGDNDEIFMNLNNDGALDDSDKVDISSSGTPDLRIPVAVNMGDGNISQPALARIGPGADVLYINGLRLSLPQNNTSGGALLSGHIDVDTDSPNTDPLDGGSIAPNTNTLHSEGYDVTTSDGVNRGVDGHFHDYDTANGVSYVDVFELEPRRDISDLTAIPVDKSGGCPAGSVEVFYDDDNDPDTPDVSADRCVSAVAPELNRAFDNYGQPDAATPVAPTLASEVFGLDTSSPLDPNTQFVITLANADLSSSGKIQIGCRVWDVVEYQDMITRQLEDATNIAPNALDDCPNNACPNVAHTLIDNSLVFTLNSIAAGEYVSGAGTATDGATTVNLDGTRECSNISENDANGLSHHPTLRIGFSTRSILDGGIHGTRSECVLGLHDYHDKVCYYDAAVLDNAYNAVTAGPDPDYSYSTCQDSAFDGTKPAGLPPAGYIRDPARNLHLTESLEGDNGKFRTRNGALTMQLLKVSGSSRLFKLQDEDDLPQTTRGHTTTRFGGTYALAFTSTANVGSRTYPVAGNASDLDEGEASGESGLLYEVDMYWHYSDLAENLRRAEPSSLPCYGDTSYNSALEQELGGLTLGEYSDLISGLGDEDDPDSLISQFAVLLEALNEAIASGDQDAINKALLDLGELLEANPDTLGVYAKYRDYAPGHVPEQHLLDIDRLPSDDGSDDDGIPDEVIDLTDDDQDGDFTRETLGPNFVVGRRTWIDLRQ